MTGYAQTIPDYTIQPAGDPPPGYPAGPTADDYNTTSFAPDFAARRAAFFAHVRRNPAPANTKGAYYELVRLAAGDAPHLGVFSAALEYINRRNDCADFVLHAFLRLLYQFPGHPALPPELWENIRATVLDFKYWPDEPGIDSMCTWTENHQVLFASAAYLAGNLFPAQTFTNSGLNGRELAARHRPRLDRWLDLRFRTGFSEWLSHVYYDEDWVALLDLLDFAPDKKLRAAAESVTNLLLLDMALNSFRGVFGATHGRSYERHKKWACQEGTTDTSKLLFGTGVFSGADNMSAAVFALCQNYRLPPALYAIANDARPQLINRQRMGLRVDEGARWGLGYEDPEDGMVWLSLEAYAHPRTFALTLDLFDRFNWWENAFFRPFADNRAVLQTLRRVGLLRPVAGRLEYDFCRNTREEVNLYTYRTPDYMLSTAQDYRPGYGGDQQHIWQATLGPDAVVFTTHPPRREGSSPNYWTGSGVLPRAAQVENVVIVVYHLERRLALVAPDRLFFTHAWFPRDRFDEWTHRAGWLFARRGDGYLALRSQNPYAWQRQPGEDQDREVIVPGCDNIWLCEMGRRATDGEFGAFVERIAAARLDFEPRKVVYHSPSQGRLEFGWQGPLRQNGAVVALDGYPRYANPYIAAGEVPFPAKSFIVQAHGQRLALTAIEEQRDGSLD